MLVCLFVVYVILPKYIGNVLYSKYLKMLVDFKNLITYIYKKSSEINIYKLKESMSRFENVIAGYCLTVVNY